MTERGEIYDPDPDGNHAPEPPSEILAHLRGLDFVAGTSLRALFASIDELAARAVRAEAERDEAYLSLARIESWLGRVLSRVDEAKRFDTQETFTSDLIAYAEDCQAEAAEKTRKAP